MSQHDDVTQILADALAAEADRVEPSPDGLRQIQARTARTARAPRRGGRWALAVGGAGLATAAVIGAVVAIGDGSGDGAPSAAQPAASAGAIDPHAGRYDPAAAPSDQLTLYYVGPLPDNPRLAPRLFRETHTVADASGDPAVAAANEFLSSTPIDPDYARVWPEGLRVDAITESDGVTQVDLAGTTSPNLLLTDRVPVTPAIERSLGPAMQAFLRTIGADGPVSFSFNGAPLDLVLLQDVSPSISPAPYDDVRAFLSIDNLVDGQSVSAPVTVTVSGNVFEGNVVWTLRDDTGQVVDTGFTTTSMGSWTQADIALGDLPPGTYTIEVHEPSPEDGSVLSFDDKTFTVS